MEKNNIPGNPLGELPAPLSSYPTNELRDRLRLLVGGQTIERRKEPRYINERKRLNDEIYRRDQQAETVSFEERPTVSADAMHLTPTIAYAQLGPYVDAAVAALNGFTGYEDNLRGQATEILLGMVPKPAEEAFTALMERAERWNEED